jgi:copper chaperone
MNLVVDKIYVENLKCGGCANTIKKTLLSIIGVKTVTPNPDEGWVEVEHEDFTDIESIETKLADLGYPKVGTGNLFQAAKSYVSCAIGRLSPT